MAAGCLENPGSTFGEKTLHAMQEPHATSHTERTIPRPWNSWCCRLEEELGPPDQLEDPQVESRGDQGPQPWPPPLDLTEECLYCRALFSGG